MTAMRRILSFRDFDWTLLAQVLLLCALSVFEIYSATLHTKYVGFHTKQMFWIAGGLVAMFIFAKIDYHRLLDWAPWAYGVCLVALAAVLVPGIGHKVLGARRWIKAGPMHFQPSEWVKLILILVVARYFANLGGRSLTWKDIFKAFVLVGIPMLLVIREPDLGTTLTYTPILIAGLFLGGINIRQSIILATAAAVFVCGAWSSGKILKPYQKARLTSFVNPDNDPRGAGYQLLQSQNRRRLRRRMGQGRGQRHPDPGRLPPHSPRRLHLCRLRRGARLRRRAFRAAAILFHIDAFDSERSNSRGPVRFPDYHGSSGCVDLSDRGQRRHGHRVYARHRNPFAVNELRRIFGVVYVPGAGRGDECPHAPVRQLRRSGLRTRTPILKFASCVPPELSGPQEKNFQVFRRHRSGWIRARQDKGS